MAYAQLQQDNPLHVRFERMLELLRMKRAEFAHPPHVSQQHINTWLKRGKIGAAGIERLRELADARDVQGFTEDWINKGLGQEPTVSPFAAEQVGSGRASIEGSDQHGPLISPGYVRFEYLTGFSKEHSKSVDIPQVLVATIGELLQPSIRVFINPGDALTGVIERGELVFVDTSIGRVEADGIYVYKLAGIPQIRRFHIRGQGVLRLSGTHAYEDSLELSGGELDGLVIGGRVVGRVGYSKI